MSDLKIHALNYLVGCFNKDHEIVTPEVVEEAQKELDAIRKEKSKRRRMSEEEAVDQASARHDSLLELKRIPLPPLDRGWYWFTFEYRTPSGGRFEVDMAAQSIEDAETRLRWIRETGEVTGQIVAEYEATDADIARARMLQRGTIPGTSKVSACCGCRWKKHADGTLQLYDADQKPCPRCDNAPNPPLRHETPDDFETGGAPGRAVSHAAWNAALRAAEAQVCQCTAAECVDAREEIRSLIRTDAPDAPAPSPASAAPERAQLTLKDIERGLDRACDGIQVHHGDLLDFLNERLAASPHFAPKVRLPEKVAVCPPTYSQDGAYNDAIDRCREAIRSAGIEIEGEQA